SGAQHGRITYNGLTITYRPDPNFFGSDTLTYIIQDNGTTRGQPDPRQASGTLTITVTPVNDPPELSVYGLNVTPTLLGTVPVAWQAFGIALSKDQTKAFIVGDEDSLYIENIAIPLAASLTGFKSEPGIYVALSPDEKIAYVAGYDGIIRVNNVSNPSSPQIT